MVLMPVKAQGENRKLARPFHSPFWVLTVTPTNGAVRLVDDRKPDPIFVALNRVRLCYPEQGDPTWTGKSKKKTVNRSKEADLSPASDTPCTRGGPVTRSMIRNAA